MNKTRTGQIDTAKRARKFVPSTVEMLIDRGSCRGLANRRLQPLGHVSAAEILIEFRFSGQIVHTTRTNICERRRHGRGNSR